MYELFVYTCTDVFTHVCTGLLGRVSLMSLDSTLSLLSIRHVHTHFYAQGQIAGLEAVLGAGLDQLSLQAVDEALQVDSLQTQLKAISKELEASVFAENQRKREVAALQTEVENMKAFNIKADVVSVSDGGVAVVRADKELKNDGSESSGRDAAKAPSDTATGQFQIELDAARIELSSLRAKLLESQETAEALQASLENANKEKEEVLREANEEVAKALADTTLQEKVQELEETCSNLQNELSERTGGAASTNVGVEARPSVEQLQEMNDTVADLKGALALERKESESLSVKVQELEQQHCAATLRLADLTESEAAAVDALNNALEEKEQVLMNLCGLHDWV